MEDNQGKGRVREPGYAHGESHGVISYDIIWVSALHGVRFGKDWVVSARTTEETEKLSVLAGFSCVNKDV